eukprot:CAMPEP_0168320990 /NCGR_PEP_ID=MMETSP0213-20121227/2003_1 /TAXON_ID=151035 /ORGANISM="Euplotes harpa, Strain FSP1.4" /LENGTH=288 /DNA_ID=CAMNT_0008322553 /DNA_START=287 /DNA_END=1149 /DNA_ORIENTATION=-
MNNGAKSVSQSSTNGTNSLSSSMSAGSLTARYARLMAPARDRSSAATARLEFGLEVAREALEHVVDRALGVELAQVERPLGQRRLQRVQQHAHVEQEVLQVLLVERSRRRPSRQLADVPVALLDKGPDGQLVDVERLDVARVQVHQLRLAGGRALERDQDAPVIDHAQDHRQHERPLRAVELVEDRGGVADVVFLALEQPEAEEQRHALDAHVVGAEDPDQVGVVCQQEPEHVALERAVIFESRAVGVAEPAAAEQQRARPLVVSPEFRSDTVFIFHVKVRMISSQIW